MVVHRCNAIVYDRIIFDACEEYDNELIYYAFLLKDVKRCRYYSNDDPMNRNMQDFTGTLIHFYDGSTAVIDTPFERFVKLWENSFLFLN